jgi:AraC family transcriptional regulator of adaptative response / DNA-3-methyladenine glycosylase II
MRLSREFMLDRMRVSDAAYDGRFVVGVLSTGIYCLPSCRARLPKAENVRFFRTFAEARKAGLRSCKRCRPDEWERGVDEQRERLTAVVGEIWASPGRFRSVEEVADAAMMSVSALFAAVRDGYHTTPGALLTQSRVAQAQRRLRDGGEVGEVGVEVGFDSSSAFYENFGRRTGMPPAAYRRLGGASDFRVELPGDFNVAPLFRYLTRDAESLTERQTANGVALSMWANETPCRVELSSSGTGLVVCMDGPETDAYAVHAQVVRMLGLDQDPRGFEDHVRALGHGRLIEGREGLRIPQTGVPFDGLVWCIVGQQVNLLFAFALRRRLAQLMNVPVGEGMMAPPTPAWMAGRSEEELLPFQFSRRKAEYLIGAARAVVEGTLDFDALARAPRAEAEKTLLAQRGIGPWAANYLMMRALGAPDCVPLGDTGISTALARFFDVPRPGPEETLTLLEPFRPHRSLACYHLWQTLHTEY